MSDKPRRFERMQAVMGLDRLLRIPMNTVWSEGMTRELSSPWQPMDDAADVVDVMSASLLDLWVRTDWRVVPSEWPGFPVGEDWLVIADCWAEAGNEQYEKLAREYAERDKQEGVRIKRS